MKDNKREKAGLGWSNMDLTKSQPSQLVASRKYIAHEKNFNVDRKIQDTPPCYVTHCLGAAPEIMAVTQKLVDLKALTATSHQLTTLAVE